MRIERSALVVHNAGEMYRLVHDVAAYPEFLRWCTHAEVHEQSQTLQLATLGISVAGIEQQFKTRNRLDPGRGLAMELEEGPFRSLSGEWRFRPLGDDGSKVLLRLEFDFRPGLISTAFERGFRGIADHMVSEFVKRAHQLYGSDDE
ncbi:MAG: type II toxin-antitoxin system RatA family toxin [Xanthomonadales bacterium]|nr:type II toxin-antitoxin system RatA family toxin [Xanthomonadales bacterium]